MAIRGKSGSLDVTEGVIWKQLLLLCVPVFFSSFFQEAYSLVNTFVVGQFAGKAALGGIQATAPLVDLAVGFSVGMGTSGSGSSMSMRPTATGCQRRSSAFMMAFSASA